MFEVTRTDAAGTLEVNEVFHRSDTITVYKLNPTKV